MLETKDLCKTYKPKKGVPVLAIDHVSLKFPEKGMVFLLGKSGSGKSTMLNLLGGLDSYDEGEIIIRGISSKDFNQQSFDSYRNTYVGFIFQEYNVLEEFTVGANIALALELQGKKAQDEEINRILKDVDLEGFGDRKPNELSGGQKQRVAIARALVKNPQIIMADEPTGALDSNTGRAVLDTLKKLSQDKLVIVVSHDREYAEQYADRIVELADGKVIRDVEAIPDAESEKDKKLVYRATSIEIPGGYHLTEEDRKQINEYLDGLKSGASMTLPSTAQEFRETDTSKIPEEDGSKFNLIKSKLPLHSAFKIGCSSLKHKRFRLVSTIFLSVVAFSLFALVDTFGSYDHIRACTDSLIDSGVNYVSLNNAMRMGSGNHIWWRDDFKTSPEQMEEVEKELGIDMTGIFIPKNADMRFDSQYDANYEFSQGGYTPYMSHFCGFAEISQELLDNMGYKLVAGEIPDSEKDEIAVSSALCETFIKAGYCAPDTSGTDVVGDTVEDGRKPWEGGTVTAKKYEKISKPEDMVGKVIRLMGTNYTVSGVVDTNFDMERYEPLTEDDTGATTLEDLSNQLLYEEFRIDTQYSLTGCAMVGPGRTLKMSEKTPKGSTPLKRDISLHYTPDDENTSDYGDIITYGESNFTTLENVPESDIIWLDGKKDSLSDGEVVVALNTLDLRNYEDGSTFFNGREYAVEQEDGTHYDYSGYFENAIPTAEEIQSMLDSWKKAVPGHWVMHEYDIYVNDKPTDIEREFEIVGIISPESIYTDTIVLSDEISDRLGLVPGGVFDSIVGAMPQDRAGVEKISRFSNGFDESTTQRYVINHPVTYELETINEVLTQLSKVFFWVGVGFAIFAALLMANFISTSISYKRQEIGILRAIGSRSADVFRIFFSESFVIALIDFAISALLCGAGVAVLNGIMRRELGSLITILHFGVRQCALLLLVSVFIAAVASFLPVHKFASKKPIDAIRGR